MIEVTNQDNKQPQIFCMKDPYFMMKLMESWMYLDKLEGAKIRRESADSSGTNHTSIYTHQQPFGLNFKYIHKLYYHNNWIYVNIYLDRKWVTKFWIDCNFAWYLDVSEVNTAIASGHFKHYGLVQPSVEFQRALTIYCLDNTTSVELGDNLRSERACVMTKFIPCKQVTVNHFLSKGG